MSSQSYKKLFAESGSDAHSALDNFAYNWVGYHYMAAFAVIIVLTCVVLYLLYTRKEHFMGPNLRNQVGIERLTNAAAAPSTTYAQALIATDTINIPTFKPDANAAPGAPGSIQALVLGSSDMACSSRVAVTDDSYAWMHDNIGSASSEGFRSDNDLTKVMSGR